MLHCVLCSFSENYTSDIPCVCLACLSRERLTDGDIAKAIKQFIEKDDAESSVNATLFGPEVQVKVKINGHKNGSDNQHTAEIAIQASKLFDLWKEVTGHPEAEASPERLGIITSHLVGTKKFPKRSFEDLRKSLLGRGIEPIIKDGKVYDRIGLFFQDADHIEKGIEIFNRNQGRNKNLSRVTDGMEGYGDFLADIRRRRGAK